MVNINVPNAEAWTILNNLIWSLSGMLLINLTYIET